FLSTHLCHCPIASESIGVAAGATGIVEITAWILGAPGDVVVFPAPCYPVYKQDIGNKAQLKRFDLINHHELTEIAQAPALRVSQLEETWQTLTQNGERFRMLVITNPDNPTGGLFELSQLEAIADWCIAHQVHLVVNEIYGLSLLNTQHPQLIADYEQQRTFQSFAQIMNQKQNPYLHLWYALSKDFGASGFRVGMVHSWNSALLAAFNNLSAPHLVSNVTQWIFQQVLSDTDFVTNYIQQNQMWLTESYLVVIEVLRRLNLPYVPARGSLFVWLDLSEFLDAPELEAESRFWLQLYEKTGVLLTPGEGFGHSKYGQFRLVYPSMSKANLIVAMQRFEQFVHQLRSKA
ncbi:MAG: aminotransferase class I/II-fold pyridoxal phosphate-dependent enzyme, partial [Bacteroidota bacterium]